MLNRKAFAVPMVYRAASDPKSLSLVQRMS